MDLKTVALSLLLLLFCSEVCSYRLQKRETQEKVQLAPRQEAAQGYWDQFTGSAQDWVESIVPSGWKDKAWDLYENSRKSANTYWSIVGDQIYFWWHS